MAKHYAGVLQEHKKTCDGRYPIECTDPPTYDTCVKKKEKSGPIMVSPPDIPPESCKLKGKKTVRFGEHCTTDRDDLCDLKREVNHRDCTDYKKDCA